MIGAVLRGAVKGVGAGIRQELISTGWWGGNTGPNFRGGAIASKAGPVVSAETAMCLSAVWAGCRRTAEMIASTPLDHYRKREGRSREKIDDTLQTILKEAPNSEQTAVEFWEGMVCQVLLQGNACAERLYVGSQIVGLRPLPATQPERAPDGGLRYGVYERGNREYLPAEKVFHLRGFGAGTGVGLSAVRYGAQSMGAALAAEETAQTVFSNSAMPAGIVKAEQTLNAQQRQQLDALLKEYQGSGKAGKIMALEAGLTWQQLQMNPEDVQLLATRRHSVEDVCRWIGVPPIVIGHASDGQTAWGTGVEAILMSWLTMGLDPLFTRIEQRVKRDLIPRAQWRREYVEFNREAVIQMDSRAKGDLMLKLGMSGTMTANERRRRLNLPDSDDPNADRLLAQTALAPLEVLGKDKT